MQRHPYFDLWLHDDDELAALIGSPLTQRTTIHEWPLSCVQRIRCVAGQSYVYKVQAPPTVEPAFYQHARSPLLVGAQVLPGPDGPAALLLEDVQAPSLEDLPLAEPARLEMVNAVLTQITQIEGDLPALGDVRTPAGWLAYGQAIVEDLRALVADGAFSRVTAPMIDRVSACVQSPAVRSTVDGPMGYVHADLCAENVLVLPDGYRVVDWQRPIWGPVALDRATLLESLGIDPAQYVAAGVLQLRTLLLIGWFAQTARRWFPDGASTYDTEIAGLIGQLDAR